MNRLPNSPSPATRHTERFAPSPTGPLHLGHAYSALLGWHRSHQHHGHFRLRIEDLDQTRAKSQFTAAILQDLAWLGITWTGPVLHQSARFGFYESALRTLQRHGVLYPCYCSRAEIAAALTAPHGMDPNDSQVYPGTCRPPEHQAPPTPADDTPYTLRLHMRRALQLAGGADVLRFEEQGAGPNGEHGSIKPHAAHLVERCGDVVVARRDCPTSYHLAVVVDDAAQNITCVTRGNDLFAFTPIHRLLQTLLGLPSPVYCHHPLICNDAGVRLSKRDAAKSLAAMRATGCSSSELRSLLGFDATSHCR